LDGDDQTFFPLSRLRVRELRRRSSGAQAARNEAECSYQ
jgi:hypothetical protein